MILFLHLFSINFLVFIFLILLLAEQSLILPVIAKAIKTRRGNIRDTIHHPSLGLAQNNFHVRNARKWINMKGLPETCASKTFS